MHVDEDDGDVLVASLAVMDFLVKSGAKQRTPCLRVRNRDKTYGMVGSKEGKDQNEPSGEGAAVPGALEDGGLDALPAARGGFGRRRAPSHGSD
jgi:hypothetical protein